MRSRVSTTRRVMHAVGLFASLTSWACTEDTTSDPTVGSITSALELLSNGSGCSIANQCASNFCVDGVCCNNACGGTAVDCQACNQAGSVGTCALLTADTPCRPAEGSCDAVESCSGVSIQCPPDVYAAPGTACDDDANPCTQDVCDGSLTCQHPAGNAGAICRASTDLCDAAESCSGDSSVCPDDGFVAAGTPCSLPSCSGDTLTLVAECSGSYAQCPSASTLSCAPYVCGAVSCLTGCSGDAECDAGNFCDGGSCVPKLAAGTACNGGGEHCASGFCADGFCCNVACGGQCEACNLTGSQGTCLAVTGAPHAGRPACTAENASCGGSCDGTTRTQCTYPGSNVACRSPACALGIATLAAGCDSAGHCGPQLTQTCAPFKCNAAGTACAGDCASDSDCTNGNFCSAGVCRAALALGKACTGAHQCESEQCVDGVCCDSSCGDQCEACDIPGLEGLCSATLGAPTGGRPACAGDGSTCGGSCDGDKRDACRYPDQGVMCRAPSCANGTAVVAGFCNGAGDCPPVETRDCDPYRCGNTNCLGDCESDSDCVDDQFCQAGICTVKQALGKACSGATGCASGLCVDGVCCDSACTGQCEACNVSGSEGQCAPVHGLPHGGRPACEHDGSSCDGACNGTLRTSCTYPGAETSCRSGSCLFGSAILPAACNGNGHCPELQKQVCSPYQCGDGACKGDCTNTNNCDGGFYCSAGICVPKLANGASCSLSEQCFNNHCVDGFCCDGGCDGQCEACDVAGKQGTCSPVSGSPHGGRAECAGTGTCAGTCDGVETRSCTFPGTSVTCTQPSCMVGIATDRAGCNGAGGCAEPERKDCAPYRCGETSCRSTCETSSDCYPTHICKSGVCKLREEDAGMPMDGGMMMDSGMPPMPDGGVKTDTDGDGIPDVDERDKHGKSRDSDGDGVIDELDEDDDGDGIGTKLEHGVGRLDDIDGDKIPNHLDLDTDGDKIPDAKERGDANHNDIPDYKEPFHPGAAGGALCSLRQGPAADSGSGGWLLALGVVIALRRKRRRR